MEMWHFKEDNEEDSERLDLLEEESEPLENLIEESPSKIQRFSGQEVNPFLESEPIENLEQGLQQLPGGSDEEIQSQGTEESVLYNAPKYEGGYDSNNSYEDAQATKDNQMDVSGGSLTTRDTSFHQNVQRGVNVAAWQQEHVTQMQAPEQKYQVGKTERFKQKEDLPFQSDVGTRTL